MEMLSSRMRSVISVDKMNCRSPQAHGMGMGLGKGIAKSSNVKLKLKPLPLITSRLKVKQTNLDLHIRSPDRHREDYYNEQLRIVHSPEKDRYLKLKEEDIRFLKLKSEFEQIMNSNILWFNDISQIIK